jgi:hypothetical protein
LRRCELGQQRRGPQLELCQVIGHSHAPVGSAEGSTG